MSATDTIQYATMISSVPSCNAGPDTPVFGATQFTGRIRLAQNLLSRCLRRQSILLYGGPKLGKTSVLLQLKWLVDQAREAHAATPPALYLDLSDGAVREEFLLKRRTTPAPLLLLDNCEHLVKGHDVDTLREFIDGDALAHAVVWAGARSWHDSVRTAAWSVDLQRVPLAVLLEGEARELVRALAPNQITAALAAGGTHPYVLKVLAHYLSAVPEDALRAIPAATERLVPFFQACHEALAQETEKTLLTYLVQEGRPVPPREAAVAVGLPTIKAAADALCCIGLISRWNLNEGAMLQANCRLFNDWHRATAR